MDEPIDLQRMLEGVNRLVEAHKHLEGAGSDEMEEDERKAELEGEPRSRKIRVATTEPLDHDEAKAITTEFIARAKVANPLLSTKGR